MKAAVLVSPGNIEVREVDTPIIKSDEVLVKLKNCGICTLEQRLYRGDMKIFYPIIPGHEVSGEVAEVGSDVLSDLYSGTPAALDLVTRCGECYYCRTGQSNMCRHKFKQGTRILGGFGEYIAVKAYQVFPIPDSLSFEEAAFAEPVACCIRSLKKINLTLGEDLLILGSGSMGLMHLQVARAMGARVFVSDPDVKRLGKASELGAAVVIDPKNENLIRIIMELTDGRGVDAVVITSPAHAALSSALDTLSKTGRVNIYTSYGDKPAFPVDANTLHRNEYE
jgi:L-iditol 2-dehydrogenase